MASLRSPQAKKAYHDHTVTVLPGDPCELCEKTSLKTFTHWRIVQNQYPYDLIAETHHMLIPIRHITEDEITAEESKELLEIKNNSIGDYNWIIESAHTNKSIPSHFHLHLIVGKAEPG
ncbi:hypothetical protein BH11PAT2_BH11PAT2_01210 [soil metagenome]